jgi:drug/metabolite transporter (DMT)-like permease
MRAVDSNDNHHLRSGLILAVIGTALFALKSIFIKFAYQEGVDTTTLLTLRMLISLPFYLVILVWLLRKKETIIPMPVEVLKVMALGFFGYYLASWLDMEGLNYISAQLERLTLYTYPIMTTLLGWLFLQEKLTRNILLALLLTYSGVLMLYAHEASITGQQAHLGVLLVFGAALSFSLYVVMSKHMIGKLGSRLFTSIAMLASSLYVLIHFFSTHEAKDLLINDSAWIYAFLLAIFSTLLPSYMVSEAIARLGAARTSIVGTAGPVFTILMAIILLDEAFGWTHLAGMLLVILGVALLGRK